MNHSLPLLILIKLLSSMKMMIKCRVENIPSKVSHYQEENNIFHIGDFQKKSSHANLINKINLDKNNDIKTIISSNEIFTYIKASFINVLPFMLQNYKPNVKIKKLPFVP